jgi:hypothetical protein
MVVASMRMNVAFQSHYFLQSSVTSLYLSGLSLVLGLSSTILESSERARPVLRDKRWA